MFTVKKVCSKLMDLEAINTVYCLRDFTESAMALWRGVKEPSGDPLVIVEKSNGLV